MLGVHDSMPAVLDTPLPSRRTAWMFQAGPPSGGQGSCRSWDWCIFCCSWKSVETVNSAPLRDSLIFPKALEALERGCSPALPSRGPHLCAPKAAPQGAGPGPALQTLAPPPRGGRNLG